MPALLLALALVLLAAPPVAAAQSAPDAGTAFAPAPQSEPRYERAPETVKTTIAAADGKDLFVETWLPQAKAGGPPVPAKLPTVLVMTPYVTEGVEEYPEGAEGPGLEPGAIDYFTARGYAVAQHHVRGTGSSGGCLEQTAANQISDGSLVVEWLGSMAPWSGGDGDVGMYGISYDAETQISVAGLGDPAKTKYLKAIVPAATVGGQYEYSHMDGVPYAGQAILSNSSYLAGTSVAGTSQPGLLAERLECQGDLYGGSINQSGDMTPFWAAREYRPGAPNVRAATLMVHGLADFNVDTITQAGYYDRLPASTPKKGLFGVWNHAFPHNHGSVRPEWERTDWYAMNLAWFDRYLKGLDSGVEEWPDVQVQGTDGQWRVEPDFPSTGGPVGQLALDPAGESLGGDAPSGEATIVEDPSAATTFETPAVSTPLHLTGQPVLDLWLRTDAPGGHLGAELEVLDAAGDAIRQARAPGYRSLRHLDPLVDGRFAQPEGKPAPTNEAIRVPLRFQVTDLRVPTGGKLRLTLGSASSFQGVPAEGAGTITVLSGCETTSALRFLMPRATQRQLDVREEDEPADQALGDVPAAQEDSTGGGLAAGAICGRAPERLELLGPERAEGPGPDAGGEGGEGGGGGDGNGATTGAAGSGPAGAGTTAPATPPTPAVPSGSKATTAPGLRLSARLWARSLRRFRRGGLPVRVRCGAACRVTVTARLGRRTVARRTATLPAGRSRTVALRPLRSAARRVARARGKRLQITVSAGSQSARFGVRLRR